jgi:nicotinamidase-related amidase
MYRPESVPDADLEQMVDDGQFGREVGVGDEIAVLIVDMTREFTEDRFANGHSEMGKPTAKAISRLMETAREHGVRGYYSVSRKGTHENEAGRWHDTSDEKSQTEAMLTLDDQLSPADDDVVFDKYKPSVFFGTQLESMLTYDSIDTLIVTGMTTSGCVRATAVDAFSYNYRVLIPQECVADRSQISHEISLFDMDMKYADVTTLEETVERLRGDG